MKVCIIRNAEVKSNAGILRIIDALSNNKNEIIILTRKRLDINPYVNIIKRNFYVNNYSVHNYELQLLGEVGRGIKNIFNLLNYQFNLFIWLIKNNKKYDIIHAFDLDVGLPSLAVTKLTKKKLVYHIADFYVDSRKGIPTKIKNIIRKLEYYIISKADATIICTEERRKQIVNSKPKKLYVVHNCPIDNDVINLDREKYITNTMQDNILTLCYVGALSEIRFIKEILNIIANDSRFRLNIAGVGKLKELVKNYSFNFNNIQFYGEVSYNKALELYSQSDIMFAMYNPNHPNHKYCAPNKVYEAMMLRKPIIVAKNTGVDKIVSDEKIGYVSNYTIKSFKEVLDKIFNNKHTIPEVMKNCEIAYKKYSWSNMKKNIDDLYENI